MMLMLIASVAAVGNPGIPRIEHLGQPCRATNVLASLKVVDREDGRERLVISNSNEHTGVELIFVDFERDKGQVFRAPAGQGSWALLEVPGDRLIVGTHYDGVFMVFDLKKMEFVKTVNFPGETYIWNLAMGSDGRIYGGTYGGGKLGALDLTTYEVEDCGAPAPPNMYLRNVSALPDGRILCSLGMEKPATLIYDPLTKAFSPAPKALQGVSTGVTWKGCFLAGSRVLDGRTLEPVDPPFPVPDAEKGGWSVNTRLTDAETLFLNQGSAVFRYRSGDAALTQIADINLRGGSVMIAAASGEIVGIRGQDYFAMKPGDQDLRLKPIPVERGPRPTLFLRADPQGRLWGGPHFGQTLFWTDPVTRQTVNTGTVSDHGGEVYDAAFHKGKVYAAAYAGGEVICYDPAQPWDQWNHVNPKTIANVGSKGYIRPTGGIVTGPDGKLYSGWMAKYGTYGGAIAITDPETGRTELMENPLGEQAIAGIAVDGGFIYAGTSLGANGLPNKTGEGPRFGIISLALRKTVFRHEFEKGANVRVLALDRKSKRVVMTVGGSFRLFNTKTREFIEPPPDVPALTCNTVCAPGDGKLYYANDKSVFTLDIAAGKADTVAEVPERINNVAVGRDGTIYVSCGVDVYAVHR